MKENSKNLLIIGNSLLIRPAWLNYYMFIQEIGPKCSSRKVEVSFKIWYNSEESVSHACMSGHLTSGPIEAEAEMEK